MDFLLFHLHAPANTRPELLHAMYGFLTSDIKRKGEGSDEDGELAKRVKKMDLEPKFSKETIAAMGPVLQTIVFQGKMSPSEYKKLARSSPLLQASMKALVNGASVYNNQALWYELSRHYFPGVKDLPFELETQLVNGKFATKDGQPVRGEVQEERAWNIFYERAWLWYDSIKLVVANGGDSEFAEGGMNTDEVSYPDRLYTLFEYLGNNAWENNDEYYNISQALDLAESEKLDLAKEEQVYLELLKQRATEIAADQSATFKLLLERNYKDPNTGFWRYNIATLLEFDSSMDRMWSGNDSYHYVTLDNDNYNDYENFPRFLEGEVYYENYVDKQEFEDFASARVAGDDTEYLPQIYSMPVLEGGIDWQELDQYDAQLIHLRCVESNFYPDYYTQTWVP